MRTEKIHNLTLHHCDCMDYMRSLPDNAFELAIVDPPYGIDAANMTMGKGSGLDKGRIKRKNWDKETPKEAYFSELKRVSVQQIIWGANHFASSFDSSSSGWIYWDKLMGGDFSDGELAYTSFKKALKSFTYCNKRGGSIHPTQKPVKLYEWLLANYAKEGDRILDTHLGSGSHAIAAHYGGFEFVGCELDGDYFQAAYERIKDQTQQIDMFGGVA